MAQAIACSRMRADRISRRSGGSSLESRSPRMRYAGSRITAAATTGTKRDPRPTSSTPATRAAPEAHAFFSNFRVQRSRLSRRNFAAEAESFLSGLVLTDTQEQSSPRSDEGSTVEIEEKWRRGPGWEIRPHRDL